MNVWPQALIRWHLIISFVLAMVIGGALGYMTTPWVSLVGLLVGVVYFMLSTRRYRRRRRLVAASFPQAWRAILEAKVAFYRRLDGEGRRRFEDDVRIFLGEYRITGLRGGSVSDDIRVLIGASAAMLTFGLPNWEWPRMRDIVVYPRAFDEDYVAHHGTIAGMVHAQGPILLSEEDLRLGFARPSDGHNVGLHELAHVMDFVDGTADGVPSAHEWVSTAPWVELVADRVRRVRSGRGREVLRSYAGTNEAELFAVAVEVFFEQPEKLRARDPELYTMLEEFFGFNPADPCPGG